MRCTKMVTEKKLAANRLNAKRSTGPRTEVGKNTSRFNAVILGLFAKDVAIPLCDGEGSADQFSELLADLEQEFQPEGRLEEFYVGEIAKSMWRFRRSTCAEKGSVRRIKPPEIYIQLKSKAVIDDIRIVQSALKEIKITGTLSPAAYAAVLTVMETTEVCVAQPDGGNIPAEHKFDDQFLLLLERSKRRLEMVLEDIRHMIEKEFEDSYPTHALPADSVITDILRYEAAAEKKFDWALQRLLESQERRRKARA